MRGGRTPAIAPSLCVRSSPIFNYAIYPLRALSTVRSHSSLRSDHYQKKATKYWNDFYKRHDNKFFKDRHYLEKDWSHYFSANPNSQNSSKVLLESHEDFREDQVNAFVCDVTNDDLCEKITPSSVDVVTLIFTLSSVSPKKMPLVLQNIKKVLKPNGYVLVRDYAIGDFAQEKLNEKNQIISENFYVRGDGTCAFYFSEDFLLSLFKKDGFNTIETNIYCKQIENRARNIIMERRWIRAAFSKLDCFDPQLTAIRKLDNDLVIP